MFLLIVWLIYSVFEAWIGKKRNIVYIYLFIYFIYLFIYLFIFLQLEFRKI